MRDERLGTRARERIMSGKDKDEGWGIRERDDG